LKPNSDTLFLLTTSPSNLYWVNRSTGQAALRAPITGIPSGLFIDGAFSNGGQLYGIELTGAGFLGRINKYTGAWTNVGLLGVIPYYAQGCAFDRTDNLFYWASYTISGPGILRRIDTITGLTTIIGTFQGNAEVDGFVIPYAGITYAHDPSTELPKVFSLSQNYPNPFNPKTIINYKLPKLSAVKLVVYTILGREIKTLVNEIKQPGSYDVEFDASSLASGIYIYKIHADDFIDTRKMLLVK
jgi:hypothetical protein